MLTCRAARQEDAAAVVDLSRRAYGPRHQWTEERWLRHYFSFPGAEAPLVLVAETANGSLAGHYSLFPARSSRCLLYVQSHIFVCPRYRGPRILNRLIRCGLEWPDRREGSLLIAFTQFRFAQVLQRVFGWKALGYVEFLSCPAIDPTQFAGRNRFEHNDDWFRWRFGDLRERYTFKHQHDGTEHVQVWKTRHGTPVTARELGAPSINCWHPAGYREGRHDGWGINVSVWQEPDTATELMDIHNWYLEIGDSDLTPRAIAVNDS